MTAGELRNGEPWGKAGVQLNGGKIPGDFHDELGGYTTPKKMGMIIIHEVGTPEEKPA